MLEQVLSHIHNRFERGRVDGRFTVEGGLLQVPGALVGQYVWVEGSVFSDGLHRAPVAGLVDETFDGTIWLLAVPQAVVDLADEIGAWCAANGSVLDSPYQSESFGGYSYTKASASGSDGELGLDGWQGHFRTRLIPWRKLS